MNQQIKTLTHFTGKAVKDWNEEDITKIIESQTLRENLMKIDVVEELMNSGNETLTEILTPVYIRLSFKETMDWHENKLKEFSENENAMKDDFLKELEFNIEGDALLSILASSSVILNLFPEYDISKYKDKIIKSLAQLENISTLIPIPDGYNLLGNLLNYLYFPIIGIWNEKFNEILVSEVNESFRAKLMEAEEFQLKILEEQSKEK